MLQSKRKLKRKRDVPAPAPVKAPRLPTEAATVAPVADAEIVPADDEEAALTMAQAHVTSTGTGNLSIAIEDGYYSRYLRFLDDLILNKQVAVAAQATTSDGPRAAVTLFTETTAKCSTMSSMLGVGQLEALPSMQVYDQQSMGTAQGDEGDECARPTVTVKRAWEEKFMYTPSPSERPCCNSLVSKCVATEFFQSKLPTDDHDATALGQRNFTLKEFYTEEELFHIQNSATQMWPKNRRPCILCIRASASQVVFGCRSREQGLLPVLKACTICNLVGVTGEYYLNHCIASFPGRYEGIVQPVVRFCPHDYALERISNHVLRLRQLLPSPSANGDTQQSHFC